MGYLFMKKISVSVTVLCAVCTVLALPAQLSAAVVPAGVPDIESEVVLLPATQTGSSVSAAPASANCVPFTQSLRLGSMDAKTKNEVSKLQKFLRDKGYYDGRITGYAGEVTEAAIKTFQKKNGLQVSGIIGAATRAKVNAVLCSGTSGSVQSSSAGASNGVPSITVCAVDPAHLGLSVPLTLDINKIPAPTAQPVQVAPTAASAGADLKAVGRFVLIPTDIKANRAVISTTIDSQCVTYDDLTLGWYRYAPARSGTTTANVLYNDQWSVTLAAPGDGFAFRAPGNGGNADGLIYLAKEKPQRTLFIIKSK